VSTLTMIAAMMTSQRPHMGDSLRGWVV
jgi:hypothetical protein